MAIFNSYVSLPEGNPIFIAMSFSIPSYPGRQSSSSFMIRGNKASIVGFLDAAETAGDTWGTNS